MTNTIPGKSQEFVLFCSINIKYVSKNNYSLAAVIFIQEDYSTSLFLLTLPKNYILMVS